MERVEEVGHGGDNDAAVDAHRETERRDADPTRLAIQQVTALLRRNIIVSSHHSTAVAEGAEANLVEFVHTGADSLVD